MSSEVKKCLRCGENYEPQYWDALGMHLLRGNGNCPQCWAVIGVEKEAKDKVERQAEINTIRHLCLISSGIPHKFLSQGFSSFDKGWQDKAMAYCKKYADDFPIGERPFGYPSLFLWAEGTASNPKGNGTGKSHLSCAIAHRIIERWDGEGIDYDYPIGANDRTRGIICPRIYFVSEPDLFRQIQATYSFNREEGQQRDSEDDIIRKLTYCDLLILDDVGKERRPNPDFIQRTLFGLIDGRYKLELPMILTVNYNADGLRAHLEDASFDRFFEMIGGKSVNMDGESYRRKK